MMKHRLHLIFFLSILPFLALGQYAYVNQSADDLYQEGIALFEAKHYTAAKKKLISYQRHAQSEDVKSQNAAYYAALSAIYLYHDDGEERIKSFVEQYKTHPKATEAYFELGNFYFREKNYAKAVQYYEKTDEDGLRGESKINYRFKLAYAYFSRRAFDEALPYFNRLKRTDNTYQSAANYYAGYIAFEQANYGQALIDLNKAAENDAYRSTTANMIANIYYRQKQYNELINYADKIMPLLSKIEARDLNLLLGDAFFAKKDFGLADNYFSAYRQANTSITDRELLYRMGYVAYKKGNQEEAIKLFEQVGINKDSLSQYNAYYLGKLYLAQENYRFATNAFQQGKTLEFNKKIAEESHFQLAKLYLKQGNTAEAVNELKSFSSKYPNSSYVTQSNELLSEAYLNSNAYDQAIAFIESVGQKSPKLKKAYQQVTYYSGADYFNQANYYNAVQLFQKSVDYPQDVKLLAETYFWMGEAYSTGKKYKEAITAYEQALKNSNSNDSWYNALSYGIAHAYYNTKIYNEALKYFGQYIKSGKNTNYYQDALIRLADCYYVTKNYNLALNYYERAIEERNTLIDYAYFQKGVIHGINNEQSDATKSFDVVINDYKNSKYYDNALFQKSLLAFESGKYDAAIKGFSFLISSVPQSPLRPYAYAKRALAYFNLKQIDKAEADYTYILTNYLTHSTANGALVGLQEIYASKGTEEKLATYLAAYKNANPEDKEVTKIEFDAAKSLYFNQKYERAIASFNAYLNTYSDHPLAAEAKYYLADAHYRINQYEQALPLFYEVVEEDKTPFIKRSILKIAELELLDQQYDKARLFFDRLLKAADNKKDTYNAYTGLIEIAKVNNEYNKVIMYADLILEKADINANAINEAYLNKGLAYFYQGKYTEAEKSFQLAIDKAKDVHSAEAKYMIALMQYTSKEYQTSINTLFELNGEFANFPNWLGKSFLLVADNYYALGEIFQAKATLNSIIENADSKLLIDEAKLKLEIIAGEETKLQQKDSMQLMETDKILENDSTDN